MYFDVIVDVTPGEDILTQTVQKLLIYVQLCSKLVDREGMGISLQKNGVMQQTMHYKCCKVYSQAQIQSFCWDNSFNHYIQLKGFRFRTSVFSLPFRMCFPWKNNLEGSSLGITIW
jgi:hypothetical protein